MQSIGYVCCLFDPRHLQVTNSATVSVWTVIIQSQWYHDAPRGSSCLGAHESFRAFWCFALFTSICLACIGQPRLHGCNGECLPPAEGVGDATHSVKYGQSMYQLPESGSKSVQYAYRARRPFRASESRSLAAKSNTRGTTAAKPNPKPLRCDMYAAFSQHKGSSLIAYRQDSPEIPIPVSLR